MAKRRLIIRACIAAVLFAGCNGQQDILTGPQQLQEANDKIVERMGLEKDSDDPPPFSFDWFLERFYEMRQNERNE